MGAEQQTVLEQVAHDPSAFDAADLERRALAGDAAIFERELLRRGVGARVAERHRCADCGRTPLVGERIHLYDRGEIVCELCRPFRRQDPAGSDSVRTPTHNQTVRIRRAA
jgi:hypothetical protein